jgi:transposase-like protein
MARTEIFNQEKRSRYNRYFSEEFKRQKVKELERNMVSVTELCREYEICRTTVYNWIYIYSMKAKKGEKQVVERKSDTRKIAELKQRIKELEQIIGQKQLRIDFQEKMIEIAEEMYQIKIKKKLNTKQSSGTGATGKSTTTV